MSVNRGEVSTAGYR